MKYLLAVFVIIGSILLGMVAQVELQIAQEQNQQELICVGKLVSLGMPRIDIARGNGKCWYEPNGYYTK